MGGAAIDVFVEEPPFDNPLLNFDNVIVTPHLGASTQEAQVNVAVDIANEVVSVLTGGLAKKCNKYPPLGKAGSYGSSFSLHQALRDYG